MSAAVEHPPVNSGSTSRKRVKPIHVVAMTIVIAAGGLTELYTRTSLRTIASSDFWWHLRTGFWVLENRAVPRVGIYSQSSQTPWVATGWLFDVVSALGYKSLDLGIAPILLGSGKALLAGLTFVLAGGLRGKFWTAIVLSGVGGYVLFNVPLGPAYVSILGFGITLWVLMEARGAGEPMRALWLAPVFLVWANLGDDFVFGVGVLGLFLASTLIDEVVRREGHDLTPAHAVRSSLCGFFTCLLATLCTPYFYRTYAVFLSALTSPANRFLAEYHAIAFRRPGDYLLLLLTMGAFLALGTRRSRDPFQISLLILTAAWSFHLHSYAWMVVLASIAVIGDALGAHEPVDLPGERETNWREFGIAAATVAAAMLAGTAFLPRSHDALLAEMRASYPVAAADFIRGNGLPRPLFNSYAWGGFLMWYLPEYPVAIDGRVPLYNDAANMRYARFMRSDFPYREYSPVNQARTILLDRTSPMTQVLSGVPGFRVAYSDEVAVVLLHEGPQP